MLNVSVVSVRRAGIAALGMFAVACSDHAPTGVQSPDAGALTSLEVAAAQANIANDVSAEGVFGNAALAIRLGVRPTEISVSVGGTTARYDALVVATVEELSPGDTAIRRTLVAWSGGDRPVALLDVTTMGDNGSFSSEFEPASDPRARAEGHWYDYRRDARWVATTGGASISIAAIGDECRLADRNSNLRCSIADFTVGVDGLFRLGGASPDAGLPALRIQTSGNRVNGVLIGSGDGRDRDPRRHPREATPSRPQPTRTGPVR